MTIAPSRGAVVALTGVAMLLPPQTGGQVASVHSSTDTELDVAVAVLLDVHALWGGVNVWIAASGTSYAQVVGNVAGVGRRERRYAFSLSSATFTELAALFGANGFATLESSERDGLPDEAHPILYVETATGHRHAVLKWAGERDERFDAIYAGMRQVLEEAERGELMYEGSSELCWAPAGYPSPDEVARYVRRPGGKGWSFGCEPERPA